MICAAIGDFNRDQFPTIKRAAQVLALTYVYDAMQESTSAAADLAAPDASVFGRAAAAYQSVWASWVALIDAVRGDRSLSKDQRDAAIFALRLRQQIEAKGARRKIILDERQRQRALRALRDSKPRA